MKNNDTPHTRVNILTGERILVSPHRSKRPWQGQVEDAAPEHKETYDPKCYLCPGNKRVDGSQNPDYKTNFTFVNDFSALLKEGSTESENEKDLLISHGTRGICKVLAFTPRHDLTLATMPVEDIKTVVKLWQDEFEELKKNEWIKYIQIFENKGSIMGCSNPHPHGQIWAQSDIPVEVEKECREQKSYFEKHGRTKLSDYIALELEKKERILHENDSFVVLIPYWAAWPYEAMIVSKRAVQYVTQFDDKERGDLADALKNLLVKYDNLFKTSFPYSAGIHQAPVNSGDFPEWHWHMHFYPPLLRSATVKKFMVGYEMMATPQRDITAELAAKQLNELPTKHYSL